MSQTRLDTVKNAKVNTPMEQDGEIQYYHTSYASETSWNFRPASGSPLFVSGWYFLANW